MINNNEKTAVIVIGIIITSSIICLTYNEYLEQLFQKDALSKGYDQVWNDTGRRVIWQKSNPSVP